MVRWKRVPHISDSVKGMFGSAGCLTEQKRLTVCRGAGRGEGGINGSPQLIT